MYVAPAFYAPSFEFPIREVRVGYSNMSNDGKRAERFVYAKFTVSIKYYALLINYYSSLQIISVLIEEFQVEFSTFCLQMEKEIFEIRNIKYLSRCWNSCFPILKWLLLIYNNGTSALSCKFNLYEIAMLYRIFCIVRISHHITQFLYCT